MILIVALVVKWQEILRGMLSLDPTPPMMEHGGFELHDCAAMLAFAIPVCIGCALLRGRCVPSPLRMLLDKEERDISNSFLGESSLRGECFDEHLRSRSNCFSIGEGYTQGRCRLIAH